MGRRALLVLILSQTTGAVGGLIGPPASVAAQETPSVPLSAALTTLDGVWQGSGVLFGRPAEFRMRWQVKGGGFVHLTFSNAFVSDSSGVVPVLSSHAVYYVQGPSAIGVWLDDRPQSINLQASVTDSSVITQWTAEAEAGRTEYLVRSPDIVVVRDFVYVNDSARLFAEATYHRVTAESRE